MRAERIREICMKPIKTFAKKMDMIGKGTTAFRKDYLQFVVIEFTKTVGEVVRMT